MALFYGLSVLWCFDNNERKIGYVFLFMALFYGPSVLWCFDNNEQKIWYVLHSWHCFMDLLYYGALRTMNESLYMFCIPVIVLCTFWYYGAFDNNEQKIGYVLYSCHCFMDLYYDHFENNERKIWYFLYSCHCFMDLLYYAGDNTNTKLGPLTLPSSFLKLNLEREESGETDENVRRSGCFQILTMRGGSLKPTSALRAPIVCRWHCVTSTPVVCWPWLPLNTQSLEQKRPQYKMLVLRTCMVLWKQDADFVLCLFG